MKYERITIDLARKDNGKKLYFTKFNCPASWDSKNILMVHGLTYTQHVFDMKYKDYSFCEFLAKNGWTVWSLDLGGYGRSEEYEDGFEVTTENAAKDILTAVEEICTLQSVDKIPVLGWSWGTMTTAKAAIIDNTHISRILWLGPFLGGVFPPAEVKEPFTYLNYSYIVRVFQHLGNDDMEVDFDTVEPEVLGMWVDHVLKIDGMHGRPNGGNREILGMGDKWSVDIPAVPVPVCIVTGDNDFYVNIDRVYDAARRLPEGTELHHYHGAGHCMYLEKDYYKRCHNDVLQFIEKSFQ